MGRYCYFSKIVPGKTDAVREHWQNKAQLTPEIEAAEEAFWDHLKMTSCLLAHQNSNRLELARLRPPLWFGRAP